MNVLNLNGQIIWVFVNLLILFLLMKKFLFGPITRMLDARAKGVSDTLDQADARLAEAEQSKQEYDKQLADARSQAAQIIAESRKRATWPTAAAWKKQSRMSNASMNRQPASGKLTGR